MLGAGQLLLLSNKLLSRNLSYFFTISSVSGISTCTFIMFLTWDKKVKMELLWPILKKTWFFGSTLLKSCCYHLENKEFFRKIGKIKILKQLHDYFLYIKFLWLFCVINIKQQKSYTVVDVNSFGGKFHLHLKSKKFGKLFACSEYRGLESVAFERFLPAHWLIKWD